MECSSNWQPLLFVDLREEMMYHVAICIKSKVGWSVYEKKITKKRNERNQFVTFDL